MSDELVEDVSESDELLELADKRLAPAVLELDLSVSKYKKIDNANVLSTLESMKEGK